jgi:hypothetical protein
MKRIVWIFLFVAVWVGAGNSQETTKTVPVFVIHQPTIIAFFPITQAEVDSSDNTEALSDFQFYIGEVRDPLHKLGIELKEAYARSFRIRCGNSVKTFKPGKVSIGYYFIAPGKEPRIEYGVKTNEDILDAAHKYFGIAIR